MSVEARPHELTATSRGETLAMWAYDGGADAPPVVAVHGLGAGVDVLRQAVPGLDPFGRLAAEGVSVLALDLPGHGRSGGRRGGLTYRGAMEALATAVEQARARWGAPVGVFGTGLGGVLAFYAGLEGGEEGVGAVACHTMLDLRDVRPAAWRRRQAAVLAVARGLRRLPRDVRAAIRVPTAAVVPGGDLAADPLLARSLRRHPHAVSSYDLDSLVSLLLSPQDKPDVTAQRVPTLLAVGSADRVVPETAVRALAARLTCETQVWTLRGGSHHLLLEHPAALLPAVGDFFRRRLAR